MIFTSRNRGRCGHGLTPLRAELSLLLYTPSYPSDASFSSIQCATLYTKDRPMHSLLILALRRFDTHQFVCYISSQIRDKFLLSSAPSHGQPGVLRPFHARGKRPTIYIRFSGEVWGESGRIYRRGHFSSLGELSSSPLRHPYY